MIKFIKRTTALARRNENQAQQAPAKLQQDSRGVATIEFALVLPVLTVLGMYGIEVAHMAAVNMQVSQMALMVADSASRLQQTNNNVVAPTVTEADVDSVMHGAVRNGENFDFVAKGRIILSSIERDPVTGRQFIHWQRCRGSGTEASAYGNDSTANGLNSGGLANVGMGATKVSATVNAPIMLAEVTYQYEGLFGDMFFSPMTMRQEAAFVVRDVRDLRAANQPGLTGSGSQSTCSV